MEAAMPEGISAQEFGRMEATVAGLKDEVRNARADVRLEMEGVRDDIDALSAKLDTAIEAMNRTKGALWLGRVVAGSIGGIAGAIATLKGWK